MSTQKLKQYVSWWTVVSCVAVLLVMGGLYTLILTQALRFGASIPFMKSSIDLNTGDDITDYRERIQIERLNLEVPFFTGKDARTLEKGVWWRHADRGNPEVGGNFILSAHRFNLGLTPQGTRAKSPFYNIQKLQIGDLIRVYYKKTWYEYKVTRIYSVKPSEVSIEAPTQESKMTLYTCTLKGSADGRSVIEAKPV